VVVALGWVVVGRLGSWVSFGVRVRWPRRAGPTWDVTTKLVFMSAERDELRELVEQLPDEEVPTVLADVRRHLESTGQRSWPPAFFGAGRANRSDVAARSEELLGEGFGRPV